MTYTVKVTREHDQWLADVESLPGAHTYAGSLTSLAENVDQVIRLVDDSIDDAQSIDIQWDYDAVSGLIVHAAQVGADRDDLQQSVRAMERLVAEFVMALTDEGLSNRDISHLLHITPGRVSQIRHDSAPERLASARARALSASP